MLSALVLPNFLGFAQMTPEQERAQLEKELKELEEKIRQYEIDITKTEAEKQTLQYRINTLRNRISQLDLEIRRGNIIIQDLGLQIQDTEGSIEKTSLKIEDSREKLAGILKVIYEEDQKSLIEILLSERTLSGFFDNLMALEVLNQTNQELLENIKDLKSTLERQKEKLDEEKDELGRVVKMQTFQKQQSEETRKEQEQVLKMTEAQYQQYLKEKKEVEKRAVEIRARIFQLAQIPDVEAPTFGQALEIVRWVQQMTGVRPAFLLSIITQESALGRNVGQCYIANTTSGASVGITTGRRFTQGIHPTRDLPKFIQITKELGKDPLKTPISCTMILNGKEYGWGGAMGPAQFIPSAWLLIKNQVTSILGVQPNPWNIKDSFLAAGVLLRENGAATSETGAAARYFGTSGIGYESTVMKRAACIQTFIDKGTIDSHCERLVFIP